MLGQKPTIKASLPSTLLDETLSYLIANTYTKLGYLKVLQDDVYREIKAVLNTNDIGHFNLDGEEGNGQAMREIRQYLNLLASESRVLLSDVVARYAGRPYGWPEMETVLLVARLYMAGEIKLMLEGGELDPKEAFDPLTKAVKHRQVSILKRKISDPTALNKARTLFKDLFGKLAREDEDGLVAEFRENLNSWRSGLNGYKALADLGKYPGKVAIDRSLSRIGKQLAIRDSFEFVDALNRAANEWRDLADDIHDLTSFYATQKPTWEKLVDAIERFRPNLTDLAQEQAVANALIELDKIGANESPYGQINQIDRLIQIVETRNGKLIADRRAEACARIDGKIAEVMTVLEQITADADLRNAALYPLQQLKNAINMLTSLPQIAYDLVRADDLVESALDRIHKESEKQESVRKEQLPPQVPGGVSTKTYIHKPTKLIKAADLSGKTFLESEDDVETYLYRLRQELLAAIHAGQKARIQ